MSDPLEDLSRRLRFPPMMGGSTECVTLPCTMVGRLTGIAHLAETLAALPEYDLRYAKVMDALQRDMEYLRAEAAANRHPDIHVNYKKNGMP